MSYMRRREFITFIGGAAVAWPLAARAQQGERMRRIGILLPAAADDAEFQSQVGAFLQGLAQSGWITGRNIRIETRWTKFDPEETRRYAAELVALAPDVILAAGTSTVGPLLRLTRTVPIVFPVAADPVAAGLVESLARPGGNATGFMTFEIGISAKWLELLKEIAPGVKRAVVLRTLATATGPGQFGVIQAVAPSLGVELRPIDTRDAGEIERDRLRHHGGAPRPNYVVGRPRRADQLRPLPDAAHE
jgi:putative ABC transport system substrate-binding protein